MSRRGATCSRDELLDLVEKRIGVTEPRNVVDPVELAQPSIGHVCDEKPGVSYVEERVVTTVQV